MTTFQMLNHQLRHMLGGIQAQKNASIEELENFQRRIVKAMQRAQNCHKKIYQAASMLKSNLVELSENYMSLFREGKYSGTLIGKVHNEINKFLQEICEESLSLSKKMEGKVEEYIPNLKKIKQKYTESAETFEHYRLKLQLLKKNVEKQSLANIKQDDHERFERNKDKLRNAQKQHDQTLIKITKRFYEFNSEGLKDIFHDFVSIASTISGNIFGIAHRLSKSVVTSTSNKDLILNKNFKNAHQPNLPHSKKQINHADLMKEEGVLEKQQLLKYLIQERQITNYIKSIMEREMSKIQSAQKINEAFAKKQPINKENNLKSFSDFKNQYVTHHLKSHSNLQKLKQPDPIEVVCQDLLSVEQENENHRDNMGQQYLNNEIEFSFEQSQAQPKKSPENESKLKKNLERFNQICQQNKANHNIATSNLKPGDKMKTVQPFPPNTLNLKPLSNKKEQKTVQVHQFFNFAENKAKKDQKLSRPQQQLVKMHEHLFNFDIIKPPPPKVQQKKLPINPNPVLNYASSSLKNGNSNSNNFFSNPNQNFQSFDFFGNQIKNSKSNSKTPIKTSEIKSSEALPKPQKPNPISFDLLNF